MAIGFARAEYVQRSKGQSSVSAAAYQSRTQLYDERLGKNTRRWVDDGTLIHHEVLLPDGADQRFADPAFLWNAVEHAERRIDSVVARQVVMALPRDGLPHEDLIDLARSFAKEHWVSKGYAVQIDIHGGPNPHIHSLISTRYIEGGTLGRLKARDTDIRMAYGRPVVTSAAAWGELWTAHQLAYFEKHGKPIVVDPVAPVPTRNIGPKRFRHPEDPRIAENAKRQEMSKVLAADPQSAAEALSKQKVYRGTAVERFFEKHVADPDLRKLVQAETLPKLAAIQHAALLKASRADMTQSGLRALSVEDVAREISPAYAKLIWRSSKARSASEKAEWVITRSQTDLTRAAGHIETRRKQMNPVQMAAHITAAAAGPSQKRRRRSVIAAITGRFTDAAVDTDLVRWTKEKARLENRIERWKTRRKTLTDGLNGLANRARLELDDIKSSSARLSQTTGNKENLRAQAQRELEKRQRAARSARAELAAMEKPDITVRHRVRRTQAPRL